MSFQILFKIFTLIFIKMDILVQLGIVDQFVIAIVFGEFNNSS